MSMERTVQITCPDCGKTSDFVIWNSINTQIDPQMKKAVRDRSAFMFVCSHCGKHHNVNYGFLYHQMEDRVMIHYAPTDEDAEEVESIYNGKLAADDMVSRMREDNYTIRIVRSQNQLLEKLAILDADLDDRLVELYKVIVLASVQKERPELKDAVLLMLNDGDKHLFKVFSGNKPVGYIEMSMDTYTLIADEFQGNLLEQRDESLHIDQNWAARLLSLVHNR